MSLHGRCVTQCRDSPGKGASVLGTEKLPEGLDFPLCCAASGRRFLLGYMSPLCVQGWIQAAVHARFSSPLCHSVPALPYTGSDSICVYPPILLSPLTPFSSSLLPLPLPGGYRGTANEAAWLPSQAPWDRYVLLSIRQDTRCLPGALTGRTGRQMKRPDLLTRKHGTEAAIIPFYCPYLLHGLSSEEQQMYYVVWHNAVVRTMSLKADRSLK